MTSVIERTAGRLLIIDPDARLLMINEEIDPGHPYWLVPGGGVEGVEAPRAAAVREAFEETGLRLELPESAPEWLVERRTWSYAGTTYDQTNHFFAVRVAAGLVPSPLYLSDLERRTFLGFGWWSADDIDRSDETFYPAGLAALVQQVVTAPVELA